MHGHTVMLTIFRVGLQHLHQDVCLKTNHMFCPEANTRQTERPTPLHAEHSVCSCMHLLVWCCSCSIHQRTPAGVGVRRSAWSGAGLAQRLPGRGGTAPLLSGPPRAPSLPSRPACQAPHEQSCNTNELALHGCAFAARDVKRLPSNPSAQ